MPGVPYEMQSMMIDTILPDISQSSEILIKEYQINTFGLPESEIADKITTHIPGIEKKMNIGYYPSVRGITIRFSSFK